MSRKGTAHPDVIVVGGGPAGLVAAAEAARAGARVRLLEGGSAPGRKLLLTGRGRCNLTNTLPLDRFVEAYGPNGRFLRNAFSRFFAEDLVRYLGERGVETARERGGRIYPAGGGAEGVLQALLRDLEKSGASLQTDRRVLLLERGGDGVFRVAGKGHETVADRVVIATGGASYPRTGSRGDGYGIARSLGHTIEPLCPALVPVCCRGNFDRLKGLRLRNVALRFRSGKRLRESFGEIHFTPFGISGPAVFPVSREIGLLCRGGAIPMQIDLKPALEERTLEGRLLRELAGAGSGRLPEIMRTLLPLQLVQPFMEAAGLPADLPAAEVTKILRRRILGLLKAWPLTATGTLPLEKGMVTAGGVRLSEIDPVTMESRLVPGLFFCGEILDVDGTTGGFNLQAAFSTGILAGRGAAR